MYIPHVTLLNIDPKTDIKLYWQMNENIDKEKVSILATTPCNEMCLLTIERIWVQSKFIEGCTTSIF